MNYPKVFYENMKTTFNYRLYDTKFIREIPLEGSNFPILIRPDAHQIIYTLDYPLDNTLDDNQCEIIVLDLFENIKYRIGKKVESIISLSQSIDGKKLISYTVDGEIKLWDIINKKVLFSIKRDEYKFRWLDEYVDYGNYFNFSDFYLKLSPDASYFVLFNDKVEFGCLEIWNIKTKKLNRLIELDLSMLVFKISPNSQLIAYLTDENSIRVIDTDLNVKEIKFELFGEKDGIHDFLFYDQQRILLIHTSNIIQEFDIQSGEEIKCHDFKSYSENSILYTISNIFNDSRMALMFLCDHCWELMIYDLENKVSLKKFIISDSESKEWEIKQVFVSPKGDIILIYFNTDAIQIWVSF
jgi:WD40 repeat protein